MQSQGQVILADDPLRIFQHWLEEAGESEINDANAMALATTGSDGLPNVRMVLLKDYGAQGFVFYTNTRSRKGLELDDNRQAAAVLHWKSLQRQVRFRGTVEPVADEEADAYFASRLRCTRIGAWASQQSQILPDRSVLQAAVERETVRFGEGDVPRPPYWNGYRIRPICFEFWQDRPYRLHERLVFNREKPDGAWQRGYLYP